MAVSPVNMVYRILLTLVIILLSGVGALNVDASTVWTSGFSNATTTLTRVTASNLTEIGSYWYVVPTDIVFDGVLIKGGLTSTGANPYLQIKKMQQLTSTSFINCASHACAFGKFSDQDFSFASSGLTSEGYFYVQFTSTTTMGANAYNDYFRITTPGGTYTWDYGSNSGGLAGNNYYDYLGNTAPAIALCLGACDSNSFSPTLSLGYTQQSRLLTGVVSGTSTAVSIDAGYFFDTSEFTSGNTPAIINVNVSDRSTTQVESRNKYLFPLSDGYATSTFSLSNTYADGNYTASVTLWNETFDAPVLNTALTINFTVSGGSVTASTVVSGDAGIFPAQPLLYENCGILNLSGCLNNSIKYLFVPSASTVEDILGVKDTLSEKFPFAYVFEFGDIVSDLYSASSTASSSIGYDFAGLGTLELISVHQIQEVPFTSWLRTIIGYLMWIMFTILVYDRTKRIFNKDSV